MASGEINGEGGDPSLSYYSVAGIKVFDLTYPFIRANRGSAKMDHGDDIDFSHRKIDVFFMGIVSMIHIHRPNNLSIFFIVLNTGCSCEKITPSISVIGY